VSYVNLLLIYQQEPIAIIIERKGVWSANVSKRIVQTALYSQITMIFSGNLYSDSPSLYKKLWRAYPAEDLQHLCRAYTLAYHYSREKLQEPDITRPVGASFNPAPARIAEILLGETSNVSSELMGAAILSCISVDHLKEEEKHVFLSEIEIVRALHHASGNALEQDSPPDKNAQKLAMAIRLDQLRHLHMSRFNTEKKAQLCKDSSLLLKQATPEGTERLRKKLEVALSRCKKRK